MQDSGGKLADVPFVEIQALREKLGTKRCVARNRRFNHRVLCRFDAALKGDLKQRRVPPKRRHNKHRCGVYISSTKS